MHNYDRQILALTDTDLERFIREWANSKKTAYAEVTSFSGTGDLGRDVVGFITAKRHEGEWHNFQCKQYASKLPTETALCEIGKILYHAFAGEFSAPSKYFFVVPRGVNRNLDKLIFNPSQFKARLIADWDKYCADSISETLKISLTTELQTFIENFDFSKICKIGIDDILNDPSSKAVLHKWFGADPGPAPAGVVPAEIAALELPYITQLVDAYGERDNQKYEIQNDIIKHPTHGGHFSMQRERFYHADAFKRFYRDNTSEEVIKNFEDDIYHGVFEKYNATHPDALDRADSVMGESAKLQPSGPLAHHARVPVKQGICHHFANEGRFKWHR